MDQSIKNPLLSICIPTYNRSGFLKVMLEVLLAQTRLYPYEVEVIVSDNGSDDDTLTHCMNALVNPNFRYERNDRNIGVTANILKCPCELASGDFVWILSDHNLLREEALTYLIRILSIRREIDILYGNFNYARYPEDWPSQSQGVPCNDSSDKFLTRWQELLSPETSLCTQLYSHIIKREVWIKYWNNKKSSNSFSDAASIYPHCVMIAETVFNKPSYYIGYPLITAFYGAQHWNNTSSRLEVFYFGLPELLEIYHKKGFKGANYLKSKKWIIDISKPILISYFRSVSFINQEMVKKIIKKNLSRGFVLRSILGAYLSLLIILLDNLLFQKEGLPSRISRYLFFNCRPARHIRKLWMSR